MPESVGDVVCFDLGSQKVVHEDLRLGHVEMGGKHKQCGKEAAVWKHATRDVKQKAKRLRIQWEYAVTSDGYGGKTFSISRWAGTY